MVDAGALKALVERRVGSIPALGITLGWWKGRHGGLKSLCRKICGFDSRTEHMIIRTGRRYSVEEILKHVKDRDGSRLELDGDHVGVSSTRMLTFKKSCVCVECGIVGTHFWKEKHHNFSRFHLNLYAVDSSGKEILMTKDHIIPKVRGGANALSNLQTMCTKCNNDKAAMMPEQWAAWKELYKKQPKEKR